MKTIELSALAPELAGPMQASGQEDFVIMINGKPGGHLLWFADEDDAFNYQLTADPRFKSRVSESRGRFEAGKGVSLDDARKRLGI